MRMKYYAKLWLRYMRIGFLCMTQYPADTMIWFISMIIREACGFVGILAVAGVTGHLGDWGIYEICLLFSMCAIIEAIGQAFFDEVWAIDKMIRRGEMDTFLVRPASPFIQMLGQVMHFQAILSMAVYVGILVWSIRGIGLSIGVREIILLIEYTICGTMINSGIYTIFNTLNFWIVQGMTLRFSYRPAGNLSSILFRCSRRRFKDCLPISCRLGLWHTTRSWGFLGRHGCR